MSNLIARNLSQNGKKLLDIGCGDGSFIIKFEKCCMLFGVDISQKAVEKAKKAGISAFKVDVSCEKLPFNDEFFDIVYMGDVIEHLINPDHAVHEVGRVVKSKGFLVLSTPNLASWLNRLLLFLGMQPMFSEVSTVRHFGRLHMRKIQMGHSTPVGHLRLFTNRALKEFLSYHRFKVMKVEGAPYLELPSSVLNTVDRILSAIPSLASITIVVAQKM
jgi:2-polyprenyl-3-methyl-5-hydroxy-6-metoxy-1,4-benzoquinol methylase